MTQKEMLSHVDHTQLKAFATWQDIEKLCEEAIRFQTASVWIPPTYIKRVKDAYGDRVNICTVVGFPLGYSVTQAKIEETRQALSDGCNEIDMVVNISDVKNGLYDKVEEDYIKTSTGFGTGGATKEDVELFRKHIGPGVKIKAAGGVQTLEDLEMFLALGCDRVGTSRAVALCGEP